MVLNREQILAQKPQAKKIMVEEWGAEVCIRTLTGLDRLVISQLLDKAGTDNEDPNSLEKLMIIGLGDEDNNRIFTFDDIEALSMLSMDTLTGLFKAIADHNKFTDRGGEQAEKNLPATQN